MSEAHQTERKNTPGRVERATLANGSPRNADLATRIANELGYAARTVKELTEFGAVNHVFVVETAGEPLVVRFNRDPLDNDDFAKEEFCLGFAASLDIHSPQVRARGSLDGISYLVQSFIPGSPGELARSENLWRQLGCYAAKFASQPIPHDAPRALFPRFGRDPYENWRKHIEYNLAELNAKDPLIALRAYDLEHQARMREVFADLGRRTFQFGLNHGDLVPKNTILRDDGVLVLLDWGSASVGLTPHNAFLRFKNPAPSESPFTAEEIAWFANAWGVDTAKVEADLVDLELLGAIDLIRWAIDNRRDRLPEIVSKAREKVEQRFGR